MKKSVCLLKLLVLIVCTTTLTSCFTMLKAPDKHQHAVENKKFNIMSSPEGAQVYYDGKLVGMTPCEITLPLNIGIDNSLLYVPLNNTILEKFADASTMEFTFVKEGFEIAKTTITPVVRKGIKPLYYESIGMALNLEYVFPNDVLCNLSPATKNNKPEQVTGDGSTSLEHTILNWEVTSRPAGADIYWRILSSTPDVKNTNKNYKSTTPYESTESFDIKGLTYNNSADVQIEITCEKPGYLPQKKVFNLRAAIDQKSINAHFTLVKDE